MIGLSQLAGIAKLLFPNRAGMIDQAVGMAQQFSPSKDGVAQLMQQYGKRREDIQNAMKVLETPMAKSFLSKIPGLEGNLRNAANEILNTPPQGAPTDMPPTGHGGPKGRSVAERLAALK